MQVLGIIPARYASTRFPGKPLVLINKKPMIQHVYEKVKMKIDHAVVATDNTEIYNCVEAFGGKAIMTSDKHVSGTSRCIEAYEKFISENKDVKIDIVINIQGDEPTLATSQLDELISCFDDQNTEIATLIKKTNRTEDIFNPNIVKVTRNKNNFALYFSRSPIPFVRDAEKEEWVSKFDFYRHVGIYAFRTNVFMEIKSLKNSSLELTESLEQLNWLHNGYAIKVKETLHENIGIDTPEDLNDLLKKGVF